MRCSGKILLLCGFGWRRVCVGMGTSWHPTSLSHLLMGALCVFPPTKTCSSSLVDSDSPSYTIITHVLGFTLLHNLQTHTHVGCTCSFIRYGPVTKDTELIFTSGLFCVVEGKRVMWKFVLGWLRDSVFTSFQHFLLWQSEAEQNRTGNWNPNFPWLVTWISVLVASSLVCRKNFLVQNLDSDSLQSHGRCNCGMDLPCV